MAPLVFECCDAQEKAKESGNGRGGRGERWSAYGRPGAAVASHGHHAAASAYQCQATATPMHACEQEGEGRGAKPASAVGPEQLGAPSFLFFS